MTPTKKDLKRAARDRQRFWDDARTSMHQALDLTLTDNRAELEALLVNGWRLLVHVEALPPEDAIVPPPTATAPLLVTSPEAP